MSEADSVPQHPSPPDVWRRRCLYGMIGLFTLTALYWLAIFPVCWFYMRYHLPAPYDRLVAVSYTPVVDVIVRLPRPFRDIVDWGIGLGAPEGITVNAGDPTGIRWSKRGWNVTFLGG